MHQWCFPKAQGNSRVFISQLLSFYRFPAEEIWLELVCVLLVCDTLRLWGLFFGFFFLLFFFSVKAVCCLTLYAAGPWGSWHKAPSLWLKQLLWTFKGITSERERTCRRCEDCECWLSQIFFPESRKLVLQQNFGTFKGTQSQGYLSAVAGFVAWVVLRIYLSSPNKTPLPLDHLVTVHDIIDFFSFICVP